MPPLDNTEVIRALIEKGHQCAQNGIQYVEAGNAVKACEWFRAAAAAYKAAYELDIDTE